MPWLRELRCWMMRHGRRFCRTTRSFGALLLVLWTATACKPVDDTIRVDGGGDTQFPDTWWDDFLKNAKPCSGEDCTCPPSDHLCGLTCEHHRCEFECGSGATCGFNCPKGDCDAKCRSDSRCGQICGGDGECGLVCAPGAICVQSCPTGECWMNCKDSDSCKMVCQGGGCHMTCEGSGFCEITQCEGGCTMSCRKRENCSLSCTPDKGCYIFDIDGPPGDDANDTMAAE